MGAIASGCVAIVGTRLGGYLRRWTGIRGDVLLEGGYEVLENGDIEEFIVTPYRHTTKLFLHLVIKCRNPVSAKSDKSGIT